MRHKHSTASKFLAVTTVCFLLLVCVTSAFAQETTGGVQGTVKDAQGAVISNATVEVTSPALIGTRKVNTDSAGSYKISNLPPGNYEITVTAPSFGTAKQTGLQLSVGALPTVNFALKVGAAETSVEVSAEALAVDVTQSKVQSTVTRQILDGIPKGRSFQSVIPFAPGARQEPLQSGTGSRDNGFQIDGASDSENVYLIDGINTTNIQNGGVGKNFQTDFIQEVQIKSSSFEAEFGGALGGVINAVPKRGSNQWHGEFLTYLRTNALNANDPCASGYTSQNFSTVCGLRLDPTLPGLNAGTRTDGTAQYYVPKKDSRRILEPGFSIGGPLFKDRLWLFTSYIPTIDTIRRTTTFTGTNPGPRNLAQTFTQHNAYTRLDYKLINSVRLFAGWNYAYSRTTGTLGNPDSAYGQRNAGASTDPNTLRADGGNVSPLSVYSFGGDWTPTSKLVVSARYGYMFNNFEQRGTPIGNRYVYQTSVTAASKDLAGNPFPASAINTAGFANMTSNLATAFDAYKRNSWNSDVSYFVGNFWGSHTFKGGYAWMRQGNDVLKTFQTSNTNLFWGQPYTPVTSTTACNAVIAQNVANGLPAKCQGLYGFFTVGTNVVNTGGDKTYSNALYFQDSWTVGKTGLTLNLGLRLDEEDLPAYDPTRFPSVHFGWGDKIAPRLGGAYDLLHNGKVKVYGSYGQFYDIMKMGLARGSFGSDYWHDCTYAMDSATFTAITPTYPIGGGCPASGPAPGVTVGRFIENVDFRKTKADPRDPAIDPNMKPMKQHEMVMGVDWAITPNWSLETRYARKRLDNTIEDMAITDDLGFYIGNPGTAFADVLHRKVVIDPTIGLEGPFCAECPATQKAVRNYDGIEFRLAKRPTGKWFGAVSYTYSKNTGNYSGLTDTDPTDGGGGRHSPNNGRAFDLPNMTYNGNGTLDDGPLATDRPHTAKVNGYYRAKWWKSQETLFGFTQSAYQGSPISTCLSVVGTSSACQWAEGRGNWVNYTRAANGDLVASSVTQGARTAPFFQSDISIRHEIPLSKTRENLRLHFEATIINLLNSHSETAIQQINIAGGNLISPSRAPRFASDPGVDWNKVMTGFNYTAEANAEGLTLQSRYGLPTVFQGARNMRLAVRLVF